MISEGCGSVPYTKFFGLKLKISHAQAMYVVGGQAPKAIRSVESYDFKEDRWKQVAEMSSRRCRAGIAVFQVRVVYAPIHIARLLQFSKFLDKTAYLCAG